MVAPSFLLRHLKHELQAPGTVLGAHHGERSQEVLRAPVPPINKTVFPARPDDPGANGSCDYVNPAIVVNAYPHGHYLHSRRYQLPSGAEHRP